MRWRGRGDERQALLFASGGCPYGRFESRGYAEYEDQLLSAMRRQFGGHEEKGSA